MPESTPLTSIIGTAITATCSTLTAIDIVTAPHADSAKHTTEIIKLKTGIILFTAILYHIVGALSIIE